MWGFFYSSISQGKSKMVLLNSSNCCSHLVAPKTPFFNLILFLQQRYFCQEKSTSDGTLPWEGTTHCSLNLSFLWQILCPQTPVRTCGRVSSATSQLWSL